MKKFIITTLILIALSFNNVFAGVEIIDPSTGTKTQLQRAWDNIHSTIAITNTNQMKMFAKVSEVMNSEWWNNYYYLVSQSNNGSLSMNSIALIPKATNTAFLTHYYDGVVNISFSGDSTTFSFSLTGDFYNANNATGNYSNNNWSKKVIYTNLPTRYQTSSGSSIFQSMTTRTSSWYKTVDSPTSTDIGGSDGTWTAGNTTPSNTDQLSTGSTTSLSEGIFNTGIKALDNTLNAIFTGLSNGFRDLYINLSKMPVLTDILAFFEFSVYFILKVVQLLFFSLKMLLDIVILIGTTIITNLFGTLTSITSGINIILSILPNPINLIGQSVYVMFISLLALKLVSGFIKIATLR
jgi:hypothetical protein